MPQMQALGKSGKKDSSKWSLTGERRQYIKRTEWAWKRGVYQKILRKMVAKGVRGGEDLLGSTAFLGKQVVMDRLIDLDVNIDF